MLPPGLAVVQTAEDVAWKRSLQERLLLAEEKLANLEESEGEGTRQEPTELSGELELRSLGFGVKGSGFRVWSIGLWIIGLCMGRWGLASRVRENYPKWTSIGILVPAEDYVQDLFLQPPSSIGGSCSNVLQEFGGLRNKVKGQGPWICYGLQY